MLKVRNINAVENFNNYNAPCYIYSMVLTGLINGTTEEGLFELQHIILKKTYL